MTTEVEGRRLTRDRDLAVQANPISTAVDYVSRLRIAVVHWLCACAVIPVSLRRNGSDPLSSHGHGYSALLSLRQASSACFSRAQYHQTP
jgi:hypothetical protein